MTRDIVKDAVRRLEEIVRGCGYEDGNIVLSVNPDRRVCQFEKGACMEAAFGGRVAEFVTFEPTRATTRLSFLFPAALEKPAHRAAACAILNVVARFLCISRVGRSCDPRCHAACMAELVAHVGGRKAGGLHVPPPTLAAFPRRADVAGEGEIVLVNGEGLISEEFARLAGEGGAGRVLLVGPSTAGVASLENLPHWCPYGKG
ncbi:MAG: hypothetical protein QFX32_03955 [Methanolinea sp.]|nr:hypothetical protein [Methanolinea sp.]